jgi:hypothetical protein
MSIGEPSLEYCCNFELLSSAAVPQGHGAGLFPPAIALIIRQKNATGGAVAQPVIAPETGRWRATAGRSGAVAKPTRRADMRGSAKTHDHNHRFSRFR